MLEELNEARLKPNPADRPGRTARTIVDQYNSTQYCSTEIVLLIFPFLQTNITSQMWPSSGNEGVYHTETQTSQSRHKMYAR